MSAKHGGETGVSGVPVDLRRVSEQDGGGVGGDGFSRFLHVVGPVVVRIVDACQIDRLATACEGNGFVEQHPDAHVLDRDDHMQAVMVAEHGKNVLGQLSANATQPVDGRLDGAHGLGAQITSDNGDVVRERV